VGQPPFPPESCSYSSESSRKALPPLGLTPMIVTYGVTTAHLQPVFKLRLATSSQTLQTSQPQTWSCPAQTLAGTPAPSSTPSLAPSVPPTQLSSVAFPQLLSRAATQSKHLTARQTRPLQLVPKAPPPTQARSQPTSHSNSSLTQKGADPPSRLRRQRQPPLHRLLYQRFLHQHPFHAHPPHTRCGRGQRCV
jgi:hypothetical protein